MSIAVYDGHMTTNESKNIAWTALAGMPKGTKIYTLVRHWTRNGTRVVDAFILAPDNYPFFLRGLAEEIPSLRLDAKHDGFRMNGVGVDATAALVWKIGEAIHDNRDHFVNVRL